MSFLPNVRNLFLAPRKPRRSGHPASSRLARRPTLEILEDRTCPSSLGANGPILFTSTQTGHHEIFSMNADGSGVKQLTNNPADDFQGAWSPDGTKIAFVSTRTGKDEIFVMNA